jgi:tetratricopeptide (TPR) repeat protein
MKSVVLVFAIGAVAAAQSPEPPLSESRLTVHTLLREDVFAGWMANDMVRFARAERNIEQLLKDRPDQRGNLLAWKGAATLHRAVLAHEAGKADEFQQQYKAALDAFAEAAKQTSGNEGVPPITGGSFSVFADRLPAQYRAAAWSQAYDAYSILWKQQGGMIDKLPVHHRGEVLSGLTQSAQRTGRAEETAQHLDRMLTVLQGTPYEAMAKQWKADPSVAANTNLTCKNCHNPGRLAPTLAALKQ